MKQTLCVNPDPASPQETTPARAEVNPQRPQSRHLGCPQRSPAYNPRTTRLVSILPLLAAGISLLIGLAVIFPAGCATAPTQQTLAESATNAYPVTTAALTALATAAGQGRGSPLCDAAAGAMVLAIGALGVWARITHGTVKRTSDQVATLQNGSAPKPPTPQP